MPSFSKSSREKLDTCDNRLQFLLELLIPHFDFTVTYGYRNEEEQNKAFAEGNSKVQWPNSKHNTLPSKAVDIAPYPIDWKDKERFCYLAGWLMGMAKLFDITLRWGRDWDSDTVLTDETFRDYGHFEVVD